MNIPLIAINRSLYCLAIIYFFSSCIHNESKTGTKEIILSSVDSIKKKSNEPYILDLKQEYPERKISLQEIAEIEYIALETKENVLISHGPICVSDNYIIASNRASGQFMVFDRKGKILAHFNHKGGSGEEYKMIQGWIYDEQNDELYVLDMPSSRKILVYSSHGHFKRILNIPPTCKLEKLSNFNANTLLAKKKHTYDDQINIDHKNEKDYILLSKKDGRILSDVNISFSNRIPTAAKRNIGGRDQYLTFMIPNDIINSKEYTVIADISSDTIYKLHQNNQKTPFIIRKPSLHNSKPVLLFEVSKITDKYIFFSKHFYDYDSKDPQGIISSRELALDMNNNKCFYPIFYNADFPNSENFSMYEFRKISIDNKYAASIIRADVLIEALKNEDLFGRLKEIASTIQEDDNPVVILLRFK